VASPRPPSSISLLGPGLEGLQPQLSSSCPICSWLQLGRSLASGILSLGPAQDAHELCCLYHFALAGIWWMLTHGIVSQMAGGRSDLRQAEVCSTSHQLPPCPTLNSTSHGAPCSVGLSHRGWGREQVWFGPAGAILLFSHL
jgi:hypothetical protein